MSEEFGNDFITIIDDDGQEFELEILDSMDYNGSTYVAFLPANMDENDPDYGLVILRSVIENGEELFESVDDEDELNDVYEHFMVLLFDDEDEEE
ncbi:MAG: DUF1292 domain-containing protein [Eubacteriales bacterium]|nr:DUF1292 domain-containing protein [Eubacteriales bacterium]